MQGRNIPQSDRVGVVDFGLPSSLPRLHFANLEAGTVRLDDVTLSDAALRDVRDSLKDGRVDLHLQPIVSLPQRRVTFYEGFTRLRRPDGSLFEAVLRGLSWQGGGRALPEAAILTRLQDAPREGPVRPEILKRLATLAAR